MEIKQAIVTGATGCVGAGLIRVLLANHIHVTAIIRPYSNGHRILPKDNNLDIIACDLSDLDRLKEQIGVEQDYFFHLGWSGTYGDDRIKEEMQMKNVQYTLDAVRTAEALHVKVFVGVGSQAEYGFSDEILSPESPCNPETAYGKAKLAANIESRALCKELGIRHEWARLFSVYGPADKPHTLVMSTLNKMLQNEPLDFTKGEQIWDYLYAEDVGDALLRIALFGTDGKTYCVGNGQSQTLRSYIETMKEIANPSAELHFGALPYFSHQVMHMEVDIKELKRDTGFVPRISFEEGIRRTLAWIKENKQEML